MRTKTCGKRIVSYAACSLFLFTCFGIFRSEIDMVTIVSHHYLLLDIFLALGFSQLLGISQPLFAFGLSNFLL